MITYSNRANTLRSTDPTITTPLEIQVLDNEQTVAVYDGEPDQKYGPLAQLCEHHGIAVEDVLALPRL